MLVSEHLLAQKLKMEDSYAVALAELPEYVIIASESSRRIIGSIIIAVDNKNSVYESALQQLEDALTQKTKLAIKNQSDLLNAMAVLGYDYVDAFSIGETDMTKIVFRKKQLYRE